MAMSKERTDDNPKTPQEVQDRIWELADKIDVCMFTTWDGGQQHSRPLSARVRRDEHAVYFLVDVGGEKNGQIARYPAVSCAWADNGNYKYAVMSGEAQLSNDREHIAKLWSKFDEAWWENAQDPTIRLLTLKPDNGELWDSPGKAVALVKMAVALVTGGAPKMGDNAKVEL
jgi:general stress protein 26